MEKEISPTLDLFKRIQNLQNLIKSEYAQRMTLEELKNHIKKVLGETHLKIIQNKLEILRATESQKKNSDKHSDQYEAYVLDTAPQAFYNSETMYIEAILIFLRKYQEYMYQVLINAYSTEQKKNLSLFTTNFFYTNILNAESINEELLIMITRCLKFEINKIDRTNSPSKDFLSDSISRYLLKNLINNNDVKVYFTHILTNLLEKIESREDNQELIFSPDKLAEVVREKLKKNEKNKKDNKREISKRSTFTPSMITPEQTSEKKIEDTMGADRIIDTGFHLDQETFFRVYIVDLTLEELNKIYQKYEENESKEINNNNKENESSNTTSTISNINLNNLTNDKQEVVYDKQTNHDMKEYIWKQLAGKKGDNIYANSIFLDNVYKSKESTLVLDLFKKNFCIIVDLINQLFENLNENVLVVPDSIKYVCKIIMILFKQKHSKISTVELNAFIAEFFFNVLMEPIFTVPDSNGLLASRIVSKITRDNIILIQKIVAKLVSGFFFNSKDKDESNFTIFNWYFIEVMPKVTEFFKNLTNVELPSIIEKVLNAPITDQNPKSIPALNSQPNSLSIVGDISNSNNSNNSNTNNEIDLSTYYYDYFKENPNEKLRHISICYTASDIISIYEVIYKNESLFIGKSVSQELEDDYKYFTASFSKLKTKSHMENILNAKKKDAKVIEVYSPNDPEKRLKQTRKTFALYIKEYFSTDLEKLLDVKLEPFSIKITKNMQNENNELQLNLIKIKNSVSAVLYTLHQIPATNFFGYEIKNSFDFIDSLNQIIKLGYYTLDENIQTDWHVLTLKALLKGLNDEKYQANDYNLIYTELEKEIQDSINQIKFMPLNQIQDKLRYTEKLYKLTEKSIKAIERLNFSKKVQNFIDECPVEVLIKYEDDIEYKKLVVYSISSVYKNLDTYILDKKNETGKKCGNIYTFINSFPNICKLQKEFEEELYEIEKKMNIPKAISDYFKLIKDYIKRFFKRKELREMVMEKKVDHKVTKDKKKDEKKDEKKQKDKKKKGKDFDENEEEETPKEKELTLAGIDKVFKEVTTYVMNRIYDKIYPVEPDIEDLKIYQNCVSLSWVEPRHLCKESNPALKGFLLDAVDEINKLDNVKNPVGKLLIINKVLDTILNSLNFISNKKVEGGVDDLLPLLVFIIIKAQPKRLASHIGFIDLYYEDVKIGQDAQRFSMLWAVKEKLLNISFNDLNDVTESEYFTNCEKALQNF